MDDGSPVQVPGFDRDLVVASRGTQAGAGVRAASGQENQRSRYPPAFHSVLHGPAPEG
jgi:hypothetical protein